MPLNDTPLWHTLRVATCTQTPRFASKCAHKAWRHNKPRCKRSQSPDMARSYSQWTPHSHTAGSPALAPRDSGQALDSPVPSGRDLRSAPSAACGRGSSCPSPGTAGRQATHASFGGDARQACGPGLDRSERAQRRLQPWQHLPQHQAEALRGQRLLRSTPWPRRPVPRSRVPWPRASRLRSAAAAVAAGGPAPGRGCGRAGLRRARAGRGASRRARRRAGRAGRGRMLGRVGLARGLAGPCGRSLCAGRGIERAGGGGRDGCDLRVAGRRGELLANARGAACVGAARAQQRAAVHLVVRLRAGRALSQALNSSDGRALATNWLRRASEQATGSRSVPARPHVSAYRTGMACRGVSGT